MEPWIFYALLSPAIISTANIIDKFVMSNKIRNVSAYYLIIGCFYVFASSLILYFMGFPKLSLNHLLLFLLTGSMLSICLMIYFRALQLDEVSRLISLTQLIPLITAITALLFLGERFTSIKYLGVFSTVTGALIISTDPERIIRKSVFYMFPYVLFFALAGILNKYLLGYFRFWEVYCIMILIAGAILAVFGILKNGLKDALTNKNVIKFTILSEALTILSSLIFLKALSLGPITLVSSFTALQPIYVLLYSTILSIFFPRIIKEAVNKKDLIPKIFGAVFVTAGAILLTINL